MPLFNKVAIIGTGLIGGSLALDIKKYKLARVVVGVSRHKKSLSLALRKKAIDAGSVSLDIVKGSDLVILAAPVGTIIKLIPAIRSIVGESCLVTDVGSTKVKIVGALEKAFRHYVGSHPLAGSEKRGILSAQAGIFKHSLCLLTPTPKTSARALTKIRQLWVALGAKVICLGPGRHDKILSLTSHLPHIVAFCLINSIPVRWLKFSSGGLRDTTRIAASEALLWRDIFLSNRKNMLSAMALFEKNLLSLKNALRENNRNKLERILSQAQKKRVNLE